MTPEGKVKHAVDQVLRFAGAYKHKPVQNGMGSPALDYHVCHHGFYAAIETKAPGETFTKRQARTARDALKAGASVFLVDSCDGASMQDLLAWLNDPKPNVLPLRTAAALAQHFKEGLDRDTDEQADDRSGDPSDDE